MKDSNGKESKTLIFVTLSWLALFLKFALGGLNMPWGLGLMPVMSAGEFGIAMAAVLSIWLGREYTEKVKKNG